MVYRIKQVINQLFPELFNKIGNLTDSRGRKGYSIAEIVTGALFIFLLSEPPRNAYNNDHRDVVFAKNYSRNFKLRLPHPDTIEDEF